VIGLGHTINKKECNMTENLLQKLEEKMMMIVSELEDSRKEIQRLNEVVERTSQENTFLKIKYENDAKKVHELILLLDTLNSNDTLMSNPATMQAVKPVLVQG
jgi:hypothetical protein